MKGQRFPPGWDEKRVRRLIDHYDNQTEDEEVAEDQSAFEAEGQTMMQVPNELVPKIRQLIAKQQNGAKRPARRRKRRVKQK